MIKKIFFLAICAFAVSNLYAQKKFTYADIWGSSQFSAKSVSSLKSMKSGDTFSNTDKAGNLIRYSFKTGKVIDTLMKNEELQSKIRGFAYSEYTFSDDEKKVLLKTASEAIYRHSTKADYYIFDFTNRKLTQLSEKGKQMYAQFNPQGNMVAFVRDNNLYLKNLSDFSEKMVTDDGQKNSIINGATDWVYEEEFSFSQGYLWSNDGMYIAYYRFDESRVKEFTLTYYDSLYPKEEKYKYPKAGEENSVVEIFVYNLTTGKSIKMQTGDEKDQYIPRIKWTKLKGQLCVLRLNRHQNSLDYLLCDAASGKVTLLMNEKNNTFIEITDNLIFLNNGTQFIYSSDKSGYNQIYLRNLSDGTEKMLTHGGEVITFYGYDEKTKSCFYQVAEPTPMERVVYSVDLNHKKKLLSPANGTASASFSSNFKYSVITHSTIDKPYIFYVQDSRGKKIRVLENNERVVKNLEAYTISKPEFFEFTNSEKISLHAWMITPPGFKANENKKYPVIVYLYGGPGRQTVLNQWGGSNFLWHQMLAQDGFIVVSVDNRGTPGRGKEFANSIYKNMGHYETIDQIEFAKYLRALSYVDSTRIGVHGWSYGGYLTSLLMTKGADYFKVGVAVAPVINWRYYDSIYTERYLSLPAENPKGYDDNSPVFFADKLKGKYLLIHGLTDDNVHFQNSAEMVIALVKNKKQFDSFYYPNQAHGISQSRWHLYEMMTEYFKKNL